MKVFSLLIILISLNAYPCSLKKPTYSLSGPMTMLIEDLGLLNDKNLKGISVFHPVKKYSGKRLGGGIFLSSKAFKKNPNAVVFYDTSKELKKNLEKIQSIKAIEINTRGSHTLEGQMPIISILGDYLENCIEKKLAWIERVDNLQEKIHAKKLKNKKLLFFIEEIKSSKKLPSTLMAQDSFVKYLNHGGKIQTYDSPLAYVAWSSKLLKNKYKDYLRVGLVNSDSDELIIKKIDNLNYNFYFRGVLIPGIRQLYFLEQLMEKF